MELERQRCSKNVSVHGKVAPLRSGGLWFFLPYIKCNVNGMYMIEKGIGYQLGNH